MFPRLGAKIGDTITLDLVNGLSGITGEIAEIVGDEDGGVRALGLKEASREDLLFVRGDLISIWRFGAPVARRVPASPLQVPTDVVNGLRQQQIGR